MTASSVGREEFVKTYDVSRETLIRLTVFHDLLLTWNVRINLISKNDTGAIWTRHIADSAQLVSHVPISANSIVDIGSGAGFPGLIVLAMLQDSNPPNGYTLIESDTRKAAFLITALRSMGLSASVRSDRAESIPPLAADVVTARAVAPLETLFKYYMMHRAADGIGLFPKGETVHKELEAARSSWTFSHRLHDSLTDPGSAIVEVGAVRRV